MKSINKIKNYSSFIFAFNIINYFSRNSDNLLISKFMGTAKLGYYDKAYKLMCYPTQNLTYVITPVLHPILSEHQDNKKYIYDKYLKVIKLLSLLGIFIMTFCFFASDEVIRIMFGNKWEAAIPCFRLLSISIWAQMVTSSSGSVFQSLGDSKSMFICGLINSFLTITAIILGVFEGNINAVSRNVGIIYIFHFITTFFILIKFSFNENIISFIKFLTPDFLIILIMFFSGYGIDLGLNYIVIDNVFFKCILRGLLLGSVYLLLLFIFKQYEYLPIKKNPNKK